MRDRTGKEGGEGEEVRMKGVFTHFYALAGHARERRYISSILYSAVIISESVYQLLKVSSPYASALPLYRSLGSCFSFSFLFPFLLLPLSAFSSFFRRSLLSSPPD